MPEARLLGSLRHSCTPMWVPGLGCGMSVSAWVRIFPPVTGAAGGVVQALSTPHGASAPFWAPCSVLECGRPVCALSSTVQYGDLRQGLGMKIACGRSEPGPLGPSRRRWLGSARFPGSGFPLTPPGRSGLPAPPSPPPPPRPRNVPLRSSPPPQWQAPGGCHSPAFLSGEPRRGRRGQDAWVPPPSHPREKFLRGPLRLWVPKITLRGKGGCEGREAGGAQN